MHTHILSKEREVLERVMPGLDARLAACPLQQLEGAESPVLAWFKAAGGAGMLIPRALGGHELRALEVLRVQRALGSRSPSLALATNMHTCTVAAIPPCEATQDLLQMIARDRLLVASGFAEGRPATSIQSPGIEVRVKADGLVLNGSKKPCSLARSMDLFTASVLVPQEDGRRRFALVTVPAHLDGIERLPFAEPGFLDAAENQEVRLREVSVPHEYVSYFGEELTLTQELSAAFLWFEIFVSASYLGAASALVERLYQLQRGTAAVRAQLAGQLQATMLSLEAVAWRIDSGERDAHAVVSALAARYEAQRVIAQVAADAAEQLGGMQYLVSPDVQYLLRVCRALAFHPPGRWVMDEPLDSYFKGQELHIP